MVKNKVKIVKGTSAMDALKNVKARYGENALVVSTKKINDSEFEVSIMIDNEEVDNSKLENITNKYSTENSNYKYNSKDGVVLDLSKEVLQEQEKSNSLSTPVKENTYTNKSASTKILNNSSKVEKIQENTLVLDKLKNIELLKKDIDNVKNRLGDFDSTLKSIKDIVWDLKKPQELHVSSEFSEVYDIIRNSGMNIEHIDEIITLTQEYVPIEIKKNSRALLKYFSGVLSKMITVNEEQLDISDSPKIITLLGPTGVGKTTTIAKLAARYNYFLKRSYKIGFIVLDTYRIGAVEQLMQYARMMKLSIEVAINSQEFNTAIDSMRDKDFILVDTMGISPYDDDKLNYLYSSLDVLKKYSNKLNMLVLSSNLKYDDLIKNYEGFSKLFDIDSFIFSKLDETKEFGNIFSFLYNVQKPVSYFTIGQEVPEDLLLAKKDYFVNCILNGFKK